MAKINCDDLWPDWPESTPEEDEAFEKACADFDQQGGVSFKTLVEMYPRAFNSRVFKFPNKATATKCIRQLIGESKDLGTVDRNLHDGFLRAVRQMADLQTHMNDLARGGPGLERLRLLDSRNARLAFEEQEEILRNIGRIWENRPRLR